MSSDQNILLLGKNGMVGTALIPALGHLGNLVAVGRESVDLSDGNALSTYIRTFRPRIIVNAAAYTAVDRAERDTALAFAVNAEACGVLACAARDVGAAVVHYSTDYVFDGTKVGWYAENDPANPISVYGASKLQGELLIREALASAVILRTSWVFSAHGKNFLKTMLRLAQEKDEINVVSDQFGAPTSARMIAEVTGNLIKQILEKGDSFPYGTYHVVAGGETNWHAYASYAIEYARSKNMTTKVGSRGIKPIVAAQFAGAASRPQNSRLSTEKLRDQFGIELTGWEADVRKAIEQLI